MQQLAFVFGERACSVCGAAFVPIRRDGARRGPLTKFCSHKCRGEARRRQQADWHARPRRHGPVHNTCKTCGAALPAQRGRGRKGHYCNARCRRTEITQKQRTRRKRQDEKPHA